MSEYKKIKIKSNQSEVTELMSFLNDIVEFDSKYRSYNFGIVRFYGSTIDYSNDKLSEALTIFPDLNLFLEAIINIEQIYEIEILIDKSSQNIQRYVDEKDSYKNNQICLEFFDDGFWEITSKDYSLIKFISEKYPESEAV
ncbi:hypothetical protein P2W68_04015 [Chryseobacterium arthrosphaerae]|uniref:hypothetical protein n=1 Tax=Chryseobacterium arthrosphaerae TaxID=651561 RepID=UPI0023E2096B|nr:hypothetical protein [Chryseobacterium arthrosphaerae]WES98779.1 hypothetical protein P2W68_04015 [Chryseobacterium arthrosphaerae]